MRIELKVEEGFQSENAPEGTPKEFMLIGWRKNVGDTVEKHEILFEYDPGKSVLEYPSPADGILVEICIEDGSEGNPQGAVAGIIETEGGAP